MTDLEQVFASASTVDGRFAELTKLTQTLKGDVKRTETEIVELENRTNDLMQKYVYREEFREVCKTYALKSELDITNNQLSFCARTEDVKQDIFKLKEALQKLS